jgi:hypothetical protein
MSHLRPVPSDVMRVLSTVAALALLAAGCGGGAQNGSLPQGDEPVELVPSDFSTRIDHPYLPLLRGSEWVYREGEQRVDVTVTNKTKTISGIEAVVVHDVVTEKGKLVEDTYDWYAQDAEGNVWYLGEDTKEYEHGKVVSTKGSWQAGVDGAQPGIVMPAHPKPGLTYRQEYYKGEAEDAAQVLSISEHVVVPYGPFDHVLKTKDYTPLEPKAVEHKHYAKGIGQILAVTLSSGEREELVRFTRP